MDGPDTWGNYTVTNFGRDYDGNINDYLTESGKVLPSVQAKLKAGKMFWLDRYEHSGISYSLSGTGTMANDWDNSRNAGILEFSNDYIKNTSYEDRERYAREDIKQYSDWANGEVYNVTITTDTGLDINQCSGFIGYENAKSYITEVIGDAEYEIAGNV